MDPSWVVKSDVASAEMASAFRFLEQVRVSFAAHEPVPHFPVLLEYHPRSDILQRVRISGLLSMRGEFHVQALSRHLEDSADGVLAIDRHLPPDMEKDRALLLRALDRARERG